MIRMCQTGAVVMSKFPFPFVICAVCALFGRTSCTNYCNRTDYATIVYLSFLDETGKCEGTLLSSRWVLTSSSCVRSRSPVHVTVELGAAYGDRNVTSIRPHPNFDPTTHRDDVALLSIEPTERIDHALSLVYTKLPEFPMPDEFENFGHMQWGKGEELEPPGDCAELFTAEELRDATGLFCAVVAGTEIASGNCASHRGGPLECDGVQTGVASWGRCDERAAYVYARITPEVVGFVTRATSAAPGKYFEVVVAVATGLALVWALWGD